MAEPVIGQINSRGVPNNEWDVYWYKQGLQGNTSGDTTPPSNSPYSNPTDQKIKSIYGESAGKVGDYTDKYMSGVMGNIGKNVANADYYNQQAGRDRGISNAKAGLSNVDTSAADEQSRRNAIYGAAGVNEQAQRDANQTLGKAAGNIATGINKIQQQDTANTLAAQGTPVPQQQSGLLTDLFGWLM